MNRPSFAGHMGGGSSLFAPTAALVMLAGCWLHWRYGHAWPASSGHAWGSDDAYITYRYTLNLWNGWGPVYNPGQAAVEGYSNPLYMFALVPLLALVGPDRLYDAAVALNAVALLATVPLLARLGTHLLPGWPIGQGLVLLLAAAFPPLWQAAASGLETAIVYALQLALMTLILTPPIRHVEVVLAFVAACLVAIRIDGFILAGAVTVLLVLAGRWRSALSILSGTTAMLVSLTLWRLSYYGLPLPNSVYAKVHGGWKARIAAAVKQAAFVLPSTGIVPWVLLPLFAVPRVLRSFAARGSVERREPEVLLAGVPLALSGYWFLVGGDVFFERFLLLAYPLGLLVAFRALRTRRPAIAALVFTVLILNCVPLAADGRYAYAQKRHDMWIDLGRFLREQHPQATLAIDAAGKVPFFSRLQTIDMLGLNDRHIASLRGVAFLRVGHNKFDPGYVLARKPDLIAAWRQVPGFNMRWGLDRTAYRAAGYCPRYLVYSGRALVDGHIRDLAGIAAARIDAPDQWNYMVLDRRADCFLDE